MRDLIRFTTILAGLILVATGACASKILPPLNNLLVRAKVELVEVSGKVPTESGVVWTLDRRTAPDLQEHGAACDTLVLATPVKTLSKTADDWQIVKGSVWVLVPKALAKVGSEFEVYVSQSQESSLTGGGEGRGPLMIHGGTKHMTTYFRRTLPGGAKTRVQHRPQ